MSGAESSLVDVLVNLQRSLQPIWNFLIALSYVLGIWFIGLAIFKLKQYGQMTVMMATHASLSGSVAYLLIGVGLLFLPTLMDIMTVTLWNYGVNDIRSWDTSTNYGDIMLPVIQLIQVIGLISFIRGWVILARLGQQGSPPGTVIRGIMHMMGGILAINIVGTIDVVRATFGFS